MDRPRYGNICLNRQLIDCVNPLIYTDISEIIPVGLVCFVFRKKFSRFRSITYSKSGLMDINADTVSLPLTLLPTVGAILINFTRQDAPVLAARTFLQTELLITVIRVV